MGPAPVTQRLSLIASTILAQLRRPANIHTLPATNTAPLAHTPPRCSRDVCVHVGMHTRRLAHGTCVRASTQARKDGEEPPGDGYGVFATRRIPRGTITWALDPLDRRWSALEAEALLVVEVDHLVVARRAHLRG